MIVIAIYTTGDAIKSSLWAGQRCSSRMTATAHFYLLLPFTAHVAGNGVTGLKYKLVTATQINSKAFTAARLSGRIKLAGTGAL